MQITRPGPTRPNTTQPWRSLAIYFSKTTWDKDVQFWNNRDSSLKIVLLKFGIHVFDSLKTMYVQGVIFICPLLKLEYSIEYLNIDIDDIFINMHFPVEMKINCFTWLITTKSSKKLQRNFHRRYGRNAEASTIKAINKCSKNSQERRTLHEANECTSENTPLVSWEIINCFEDEPKQSLRRLANQCDVSLSTITVHIILEPRRFYNTSELQKVWPSYFGQTKLHWSSKLHLKTHYQSIP